MLAKPLYDRAVGNSPFSGNITSAAPITDVLFMEILLLTEQLVFPPVMSFLEPARSRILEGCRAWRVPFRWIVAAHPAKMGQQLRHCQIDIDEVRSMAGL